MHEGVRPQLGQPRYFCLELFCGSGNLTYAMKRFFSDSFGVDHKARKQKVKVVCLDLTQSKNQDLIFSGRHSKYCIWVHFGVPCGTSSKARLKRLNKKHHGPPPLRTPQWPNGLPSLSGANLQRARVPNRLYHFMERLITQLQGHGITWTVENPWTSLLWLTKYWIAIAKFKPYYAEVHNCMYGGQRLKRSCFASNSPCIMQLQVFCDNQHVHLPWTAQNGVFDTSLGAEYLPMLAKTFATIMIEGIAQPLQIANAHAFRKKMKLSHFQALASQKQPSRNVALPTVPDFSRIIACSNFPTDFPVVLHDGSTAHCFLFSWNSATTVIPCGSKLLRKTVKQGGISRLTKASIDQTMSLQNFGDVAQLSVANAEHGSTL